MFSFIFLIFICDVTYQERNESLYSCGFVGTYTTNCEFGVNQVKLLDAVSGN